MLRRRAGFVLGLVAVVSFALLTPLAAASSQPVWSGRAVSASGILLGTDISASGQWTKYPGNPILSPTPGWSPAWTIAPDVLYDNGVYKMWYQGCTSSNCSIGYTTSSDGTTWAPYAGNPVLASNRSSWDASIALPRVIHDGAVYRMWYAGNGRLAIRIGYATSSDGIHWVKYGAWPVFNGTMAWDSLAANTPAVVKVGSLFVMYFSGTDGSGGYGYSMGRATSTDGIHWTEYAGNPVLVARGGWEGNRVHPSWFSVGTSGYDLYYSGGTVGTPVQIGHATSLDGLTWTEDSANPVLRPDAAGSWDQWAVAHPYLITVGTQTRMYFTGYNDSANILLRIGYATLGAAGSSASYAGLGLLGFVSVVALLGGVAVAVVALALWARQPAGPVPPASMPAMQAGAGSFCPRCGAPVPPQNSFCGRCGQPVSPPGSGGPPVR